MRGTHPTRLMRFAARRPVPARRRARRVFDVLHKLLTGAAALAALLRALL